MKAIKLLSLVFLLSPGLAELPVSGSSSDQDVLASPAVPAVPASPASVGSWDDLFKGAFSQLFGSQQEEPAWVPTGKEFPDTKQIQDPSSGIQAQVTFLNQSNMQWKWLHDDVVVVIASGALYGSENHGRDWRRWTDLKQEIKSIFLEKGPGSMLESGDGYSARLEKNNHFYITTSNRTYLIQKDPSAPPKLTETMITFPGKKPESVVFDSMTFHPTRPDRVLALQADRSNCLVRPCRQFVYLNEGSDLASFRAVVPLPFLDARWENPLKPKATAVYHSLESDEYEMAQKKSKNYDSEAFVALIDMSTRKRMTISDILGRTPRDTQVYRIPLTLDGRNLYDVELTSRSTRSLLQRLARYRRESEFSISTLFGSGGYEFAQGRLSNGSSDEKMFVSTDNFVTLHQAEFPWQTFNTDGTLIESGHGEAAEYIILDVQEDFFVGVVRLAESGGQFMMAGRQPWMDLYVSGIKGQQYTLSLPYMRTDPHGVDFRRLASIAGLVVANQVTSIGDARCRMCDSREQCEQRCAFATKMSYNNGIDWARLPIMAECPTDVGITQCSLHLHLARYPPHSSIFSPGMIIALGNVGESLNVGDSQTSPLVDVFLSRDAGLTWKRIASGPHSVSETDFGGLIFMVPVEGEATKMKYSYDIGESFHELEIAPGHPLFFNEAFKLPFQPLKKSVLLTARDNDFNKYFFFVDFSKSKERTCGARPNQNYPGSDDYQMLRPKAPDDGCIMGRQEQFAVRKPGVACWEDAQQSAILDTLVKPITTRPCQCTQDDYECDIFFFRGANRKCVLAEPKLNAHKKKVHKRIEDLKEYSQVLSFLEDCSRIGEIEGTDADGNTLVHMIDEDGEVVTKGYRKIGGNGCIGGKDLNPVPTTNLQHCDRHRGSHKGKSHGHIIAFLALAVAGGLIVALFLMTRQASKTKSSFDLPDLGVDLPDLGDGEDDEVYESKASTNGHGSHRGDNGSVPPGILMTGITPKVVGPNTFDDDEEADENERLVN